MQVTMPSTNGTSTSLAPVLGKLLKDEFTEALTPAAVETLSIIAYGGPVTRSVVDYIRGVNSSFILRTLLLRGLIDRVLDLHHGNAYVYQASFDMLKHLGLDKAESLPDYQVLRDIVQKLVI